MLKVFCQTAITATGWDSLFTPAIKLKHCHKFFAVLSVQDGVSPVYFASQEGHTDVVDLLVQAGADIHLAEPEVHVSTHTQCPLQ